MKTIVDGDRELPATELRHPLSSELDTMETRAILDLLNDEDQVAVSAARAALPALARLVDATVPRVRRGGRVHYFGAGTSGRLGVLDSAELVPTFGTDPQLVRAWIAGGTAAILQAVEDSEDSYEEGSRTARDEVGPADVVVGLTVSGTTPYVEGALVTARERGALTALITSNAATPLSVHCDHLVVVATGPEVLTGSTRLKAGTATKILLNGFSTTLMIHLGRSYSNLMVSVVATNAKLRRRTLRILGEITGGATEDNARLLNEAGGDLRVAVVSHVAAVPVQRARQALEETSGSVADALDTISRGAR